jgi:hypothetical protein
MKLFHVLVHFSGRHIFERRAYENGTLHRVAVIQKLCRDGSES